jgi:hypothetical protein
MDIHKKVTNTLGGGNVSSELSLPDMPPIMYGTAWKKEQTEDLVVEAVKQGFRGIDTACQPKHYDESGMLTCFTSCQHALLAADMQVGLVQGAVQPVSHLARMLPARKSLCLRTSSSHVSSQCAILCISVLSCG